MRQKRRWRPGHRHTPSQDSISSESEQHSPKCLRFSSSAANLSSEPASAHGIICGWHTLEIPSRIMKNVHWKILGGIWTSCSFGELTHWKFPGVSVFLDCVNERYVTISHKAPSSGGAFTGMELLSPIGQISKWRSKAGEEDSVPPRSLPELVAKPEDMLCQAVHWHFPHHLHFDNNPVNVNYSIAPALNRFLWFFLKKRKKIPNQTNFPWLTFPKCFISMYHIWGKRMTCCRTAARRSASGKPWYTRISHRVSFSKLLL